MSKYIPNLERVTALLPLLKRPYDYETTSVEEHLKPATKEEYTTALNEFEEVIENNLIKLFSEVGIRGTIKNDRKSLPYKKEIKTVRRITFFTNDAYCAKELKRNVLKYLLDNNIRKIRFYVDCEHTERHEFKISFRYYEPKD